MYLNWKTTLNLNNFELEKINFHQMMKTVNRIPIFIILNETISDFFSAWLITISKIQNALNVHLFFLNHQDSLTFQFEFLNLYLEP